MSGNRKKLLVQWIAEDVGESLVHEQDPAIALNTNTLQGYLDQILETSLAFLRLAKRALCRLFEPRRLGLHETDQATGGHRERHTTEPQPHPARPHDYPAGRRHCGQLPRAFW